MKLQSQLYLLARQIYRNFAFQTRTPLEACYQQIKQNSVNQSSNYLYSLLDFATIHVPYYLKIGNNYKHGDFQFQDLPILTKAIIRKNFEELKSDDLTSRQHFLNSSGGSTGKPLQIIQDRDYVTWREATKLFYHRQFLKMEMDGINQVVLWGSASDIALDNNKVKNVGIKNKILNWIKPETIWLNSFKMNQNDLYKYVQIINKERPILIKAYAGSLYQLAKFIKDKNLSIYSPKLLYTSAETLRPFMRELIEEVFECKIYDFYGSREVGAIAGQCSQGKMHIFNFNNYVEVVDKNNKLVNLGEEGRVLITTLHNYAMPLIRYEIGDLAILGKSCDCGSKLPTLERVTGRVKDHFITKEGTLVDGGYFTRQFYFRDWIDEFQVLQQDYNQIEIFYVPRNQPIEAEMNEICHKIRLAMGKDCEIKWNEVTEVPRTPQGKLLYTRSLVLLNESNK